MRRLHTNWGGNLSNTIYNTVSLPCVYLHIFLLTRIFHCSSSFLVSTYHCLYFSVIFAKFFFANAYSFLTYFALCCLQNKETMWIKKNRYESESVYASESDFGWSRKVFIALHGLFWILNILLLGCLLDH